MGCGASTAAPPSGGGSAPPAASDEVVKPAATPTNESDASKREGATDVPAETNAVNAPSSEPEAGGAQTTPGPEAASEHEEEKTEEEEEEIPTHEQAEELFEAIGDGDLDQMQSLIESGVPLGVRDEDGNTPLHKACEGETECVRSLLTHLGGKHLERKNNEDETALMTAIRYEDANIVEMLKEAGAKVSTKALGIARQLDVPEIVRCLTGEDVADRMIKQRRASEQGDRRVSVSGDNIKDFTGAFTNEKEVRRASLMGAQNNNDAELAARLVPERPEEDEDEEAPPP